jgi:hypothetical protein
MASTSNSSGNYIPGSVWEARRRPWRRSERSREEAFATLVRYTLVKGDCWITSLPGDSTVVMECLPDSDVPQDLARRGYDLRPADPPEGQRIVANARSEDVLIEGSTRATIRTMREGIVKVLRYTFPL